MEEEKLADVGHAFVDSLVECDDALEVKELVEAELTGKTCILKQALTASVTRLVHLGEEGSRGVLLMVRLYEAVAEVVVASSRQPTSALAQQVIDHLMWLCAQRTQALELLNRYPEDVEKLVSTCVFRSILQAKYDVGCVLVFRFEFAVFLVLAVCFSWIAYLDLFDSRAQLLRLVLALIALPCVHYFTVRTEFQMRFLAKAEIEAEKSHRKFMGVDSSNKHHLFVTAFCCFWVHVAWLLHRVTLVVTVLLFGPLMYFVARCFIPRDRLNATVKRSFQWFLETPKLTDHTHVGDLLTEIGIPKVWRDDTLNWCEVLFLTIVWATLVYTGVERGTNERRPAYFGWLNTGILLMWLRLLSFLTGFRQYAPFVILLTRVLYKDLKAFSTVLLILIAAFAHSLYVGLGSRDRDYFEDLDDDEERPFRSPGQALYTVYLIMFLGEINVDHFPRDIHRLVLGLLVFVMVIVMLNALIAVVTASYEDAMKRSTQLFWRSRFEFVVKTFALWGPLLDMQNEIELRKAVTKAFGDELSNRSECPGLLDDHRSDSQVLRRVLDIVRRNRADLDDLGDDLANLHAFLNAGLLVPTKLAVNDDDVLRPVRLHHPRKKRRDRE